MKKISFIGTGVMGSALAKAACKSCGADEVAVTDFCEEKAKALAEETGAEFVKSNIDAVKCSKYILIGVKPQVGHDVLSEIGPTVAECIKNG